MVDSSRVPADLSSWDPDTDLGQPGEFPFTRGIQPTMYRGRLWTMRQYAGFGTATESNRRYRHLLAQGVTGLSVAFDLPTQMGYDSDHALAAGEVGRVGVAIDSLDDMAELFDGIPLDRVSTSMTINSTAIILLAMYVAIAERQGIDRAEAVGHSAERHPQGVSGARHVHLSATGVAPAGDRHFRLLRARAAALERDFRERVPHSRGRLDGRAGGCVHAGERHRVYRGRARAGAVGRIARRAHVVLLRGAQRFSRGDCEVPRRAPHVGAHHERAIRRNQPARAAAAVSRADRRQHADGAAARQQSRPRHGAGACRRARRRAVAALQQPRRGACAADGGICDARASNPADHRARVGGRQHGRPGRRLVRDRKPHQRDRA